MRKLVTIDNNEKYLRQVSKKVDFNDKDLAQDIAELKEYTLNNAVFAMASVQIGIPKRLLFVRSRTPEKELAKDEEQILMINPEIISQRGKTEYLEACKSCMAYGGWVERPYEIVVKYQDIKGNFRTEKFEGFTSTILSHEIDHLDGILHMDRAKKVYKMSVEERVEFRKTHPYKVISKDCEFSYPKPEKFEIKKNK